MILVMALLATLSNFGTAKTMEEDFDILELFNELVEVEVMDTEVYESNIRPKLLSYTDDE